MVVLCGTRLWLSFAALLLLGGCTLTPEQQAWNRAHHVGELLPAQSGPSPSVGVPAGRDSEDQQRQAEIKRGEDLENEEARKAGFGPSPTEGMDCATSSSFSGSASNGTSTSHTSCHN